MPSIQIEDLSEDTYEALERLAFAAGQSVSQYVRALVLREARPQHHAGGWANPGSGQAWTLSTRQQRTRHAFGETSADARDSGERWRDL